MFFIEITDVADSESTVSVFVVNVSIVYCCKNDIWFIFHCSVCDGFLGYINFFDDVNGKKNAIPPEIWDNTDPIIH